MINFREKLSIVSEEEIQEGEFEAKAVDYELIRNKDVIFGGKKFKKNVLNMTFELENGIIKYKEMIFTLNEKTEFGKFATAVKGTFPKEIKDVESELLNKKVTVEIKENIKDGKSYYNIVGFKHLEQSDDDITLDIGEFLED